MFEVGVQRLDSFGQIGASRHALATKYLLHHFAGGLAIAVHRLKLSGHLFQCIEHCQCAIVQLFGHLFSVNAHLGQRLTGCFCHQSDILDAHDDGVHILVGEDTALRVLDDCYQLRSRYASVAEGRCILLNHGEQLRTVALNHAAHTVLDQLRCFVTCLSELRHQRIGSIHGLAEIDLVCI